MNRLLTGAALASAALLLGAAPAAAQLETAGKGALLFNYGGLFNSTPGAFDDIGIGGRYFLDRSLAIRAAVGMGLSTEAFENDSDNGNDDVENNQSLFSLEGGVEYVLARTKTAYLYTGGIIQLSTFEDDPEGRNNNTDRTGLAVAALLGANYFVAESLSIGAEYRLGVSYASTERQDNDVTATTTTIGTGTVGFHLGFWFN